MIALLAIAAAFGGEVPSEAGDLALTAQAGFRHVATAGVDWSPANSVGLRAWTGARFDRPAWTPTAGFDARVGALFGRTGLGIRGGAEWLGGLGGGGRAPSADVLAVGFVESSGRSKIYGGGGAMALVMKDFPTVLCLLAEVGGSVPVSDRTSLTARVALPFYQVTGPDLPGVNPSLAAGVRVSL